MTTATTPSQQIAGPHDVRDVIALMRINYDRVAGAAAAPADGQPADLARTVGAAAGG